MKSMLGLRGYNVVAFFNKGDMQAAKALRAARPDLFRYRRIIEIIQAYPNRVKVGVIYNTNTGEEYSTPYKEQQS